MAVEVVMPKLGMSMKEGTVSVWNKKVGEAVEKGESIASINSEKIEMEIEAPAKGTVLDIKVPEGEGVPPGTVICYIGDSSEQTPKEQKPKWRKNALKFHKRPVRSQKAQMLTCMRSKGRGRAEELRKQMF